MSISIAELCRFLQAAKRATYAAQGDEASVAPLLPGSKQLEYRDGELFYRDIYVGLRRFAGQEIVYRADRAIWSMSYAGGVMPGIDPGSIRPVYAFLRAALREIPADLPLRGPALFQRDGLRYECRCTGSIEQFRGAESITRDAERLYQLEFAGGSVA